jgi:hypothetical protein
MSLVSSRRVWLGAAAALVAAACSIGASATYPPLPTFPVPAEVLATETEGPTHIAVTCGSDAFPLEALDAPTGAEDAAGAEFDALRATLQTFRAEFPGSDTWSWRLVRRDETSADFLAQTNDLGPPGWVYATLSRGQVGWRGVGMGQCDPKVVLSPEFGPASWALDPEFPTPEAATTELRILVWERACSSGAPATGRISAPAVVYGSATVTITLGVRPIQVPAGHAITCPGPPGTPAILRTSEPLGSRQLLDGGSVPPAPPKPMLGP